MKIIQVADPILDVPRFTEHLPKHHAVVMVYMMKGCPHCDMLKPKWETVKKILKNDRKFDNVMMADIDSQASQMLPFPPVMGFPSIKIKKGNRLEEYKGMREVDPLLTFLRKTVTTPAHITKRRRTARRRRARRNHHNYPKHRRSPHRSKSRSTARRSKSSGTRSKSRSTARRSKSRSTARRSKNSGTRRTRSTSSKRR
jgi:thiol-disulfide isomerase/thioredoxin